MVQGHRNSRSFFLLVVLASSAMAGCSVTVDGTKERGESETVQVSEGTLELDDTGDSATTDDGSETEPSLETGTDRDADGVTVEDGDCDDGDATVFPGAPEYCEDGIDSACTGSDSICLTVVVEGPVALDSQADMEAFCDLGTVVDGDLTIRVADDTGLSALACLQGVRGDLTLRGRGPGSLEGLGALRSIDGDLIIGTNTQPESFDGLSQLTRVGGQLALVGDGDASTVSGGRFDRLEQVGTLRVAHLQDLALPPTFPRLATIEHALELEGLDGSSMPDFPVLAQAGSVSLTASLSSEAPAFPLLAHVDDHLHVSGNPNLTALDGFEALAYLPRLSIADNASLASAPGFPALTAVKTLTIDVGDIDASGLWLPAMASVTGAVDLNASGDVLPRLAGLTSAGSLTVSGAGMAGSRWAPLLSDVSGDVVFTVALDGQVIDGPDALTSVGGDFSVDGEPSIVHGFEGLEQVAGDVHVPSTNTLTTFTLPGLRTVGGSLVLDYLPQLETLDLSALEDVGGDLTYRALRYASSEDLPGALRRVGGDLTVDNLISVRTLDGLSSLEEVHGSLYLTGIQKLTDPYGIGGLERVGGDSEISGYIWIADEELTWLEAHLAGITEGTFQSL